ncbi:MAG: hypothetical protein ACJ8AO_22540 [Gemmatimonadaceae bacterium]
MTRISRRTVVAAAAGLLAGAHYAGGARMNRADGAAVGSECELVVVSAGDGWVALGTSSFSGYVLASSRVL